MPVMPCWTDDKMGFRWGEHGKCYTFSDSSDKRSVMSAWNKAAKQGRAIKWRQTSGGGMLMNAGTIKKIFGAYSQGESGGAVGVEPNWDGFSTSGDYDILWEGAYGEQDWPAIQAAQERTIPKLKAIFTRAHIPPTEWNADTNPRYFAMLMEMKKVVDEDKASHQRPTGVAINRSAIIDEVVRGARDAGHPDPEVVGENINGYWSTWDPSKNAFCFGGKELSPYEFGKWYTRTEEFAGHGFAEIPVGKVDEYLKTRTDPNAPLNPPGYAQALQYVRSIAGDINLGYRGMDAIEQYYDVDRDKIWPRWRDFIDGWLAGLIYGYGGPPEAAYDQLVRQRYFDQEIPLAIDWAEWQGFPKKLGGR